MSRTLFVSTFVLALLVQVMPAFADTEEPPATPKGIPELSLDRYIGRELVTDGRAAKAGITRTLPLSCPPFPLLDEDGNIIDPTEDELGKAPPVSTRKTCGACHDYEKITRGYHFQMGRDELVPEGVDGAKAPVSKGPGFFGKWQLLYQRELAPKHFEDPTAVDMTAFEWITSCGICHPGGGPAEVDRGWRRYDEQMAEDHGLALFGDGDYYNSQWDMTGVVEADCFICHLETYDYSVRVQQLKKLNFKWASTAAAGFGFIWGSLKDGQEPGAYYRKELFGPDKRVHLKIRRPSDRQCMTCHDMSSVAKRGSSWHTPYMQDVHTQQGLHCTDCHPGDIRHNFAKGQSSSQTVRDDLDQTALSCEECHTQETLGAPDYDHPGLPPLHLERMDCTTCHITHRPFVSVAAVDTLTGDATELPYRTDPREYDGYALGAKWGWAPLFSADTGIEPYTDDELQTACDLLVSSAAKVGEYVAAKGIPAPSAGQLVEDYVGQLGGVDSGDGRAVMLLALAQAAGKGDDAEPICLYRGRAYAVRKNVLKRLGTALQPARPGATIAESPYTLARSAADDKIYPEGYQLGVFWAFMDGDTVRPLFLSEMKGAWDYLHSEERRVAWYPGAPSDGKESLAIPNPAEASEDEVRAAFQAKLAQYPDSDRKRLDVYDDNNDTYPEANTDEEMGLVAWALVRTVDRLSSPELLYIKGTNVYRVKVVDAGDPYAVATNELPAIEAGVPFLAEERYEYVKKPGSSSWTSRWKWEHAETRLSKAYSAEVEEVDPATMPAVAELAQRLPWTVSHGVEPPAQALGANGCTDCHSPDAHFFFGDVVVDPFTADATPETVPMHDLMGYSRGDLLIGAWREGVLKPWSPWIVLAVAVLILLHFAVFGVKGGGPLSAPDLPRFGLPERMSHLVAMSTIVFLGVTGFCFLLGQSDPLGGWARSWHTLIGYVASAGVAAIFLCWVFFMFPAKGDVRWLLKAGGYLGGVKGHLPAGRFNAGQKILFWKAIGLGATLAVTGIIMGLNRDARFAHQELVYTIHDVAALFMILLLMGHIYLAMVVVPHSMRSLFGGKVSEDWAKQHHPDWKPKKK